MLEQLWSTVSTRGLSGASSQRVSVLAGKAFFIPPRTWKKLYLPYKIQMIGGATVALSLQKDGLIAGSSLTKAGEPRVNAYNTTNEVVHIAPKIVMAAVWAGQLEVKYLG